jgi:methylated-DNA-protein-cysteine methyltransferase related protein
MPNLRRTRQIHKQPVKPNLIQNLFESSMTHLPCRHLGETQMVTSFDDAKKKIIAVICEIPFGQVASYGQVAQLAGIPRGARQVARILRDPQPYLASDQTLPWWRVLRSDGSCAVDGQLSRLRMEGINAGKRVDMQRYRWQGLDFLLFGDI